MKNIFKTIWNSKAFETMAEINYEVMTALGECLLDIFDSSSYCTPKEKSVEEQTYDYWMSLSSIEQQEYYAHNEYLQRWGENYRYDARHQIAKSVAEIARKENRSFTNKYDRY
jgi:hypothetical protein